HAHRRDETVFGINQWGFRGPIQSARSRGVAIAWLGGTAAFAGRTPWWNTLPALLAERIRGARVNNLSEPAAGANSYVAALHDYAYLPADIVCIYDGYDDVHDVNRPRGRRDSLVFRTVGYLPESPRVLAGAQSAPVSD